MEPIKIFVYSNLEKIFNRIYNYCCFLTSIRLTETRKRHANVNMKCLSLHLRSLNCVMFVLLFLCVLFLKLYNKYNIQIWTFIHREIFDIYKFDWGSQYFISIFTSAINTRLEEESINTILRNVFFIWTNRHFSYLCVSSKFNSRNVSKS